MSDRTDIYWDLKELNPEAIVYTEYEDAFIGFALKDESTWVACYGNEELEEMITKEVVSSDFIEEALQSLSGKVKESQVQEEVFKLAKTEALQKATDLIQGWTQEKNAPICVFLPKVFAEVEQEEDEIWHYEQ
jgi:hypothetical protein